MLLVLGAAVLLAQPSPQLPHLARGRVEGRVVSTYANVTGVTVVLARLDGPSDRQMVTTDTRGRFAFERVADGRYELSAVTPDFTSRRLREGASRFDPGEVVTVRGGGGSRTINLRLRRTSSVSGRVIRSNGAAAPGINVVLAVRRGRDLVPLPETQTTTSWDGRYAMTDLPPGEYLLLAASVAPPPTTLSHTEQAAFEINLTRPEDFTPTLYPGVPATEAGEAIRLLEGVASDGIDIWLTPARRFSISGRVVWPDGVAVHHVAIEYGNPSDRRASVWSISDPGGLFTIDGVAPGTVVLLASAQSDRGPLMGVLSTDVHVADVEDLTLTLAAPGVVAGRVALAPGIPIASQPKSIALVPTLLKVSPLYPTPEAAIGPDGAFRLTNVLGEYEFTLPGLPPTLRITSVSRNGNVLTSNRLGIVAGETIDGIVVTVGP